GLDLAAYIYVNGKQVAKHTDFYYPCRIDVTDAVHAGENQLAVRLDSGMLEYARKSNDHFFCCDLELGYMMNRMHARKPQNSYEWDWCPRCLTVGIFKPCYIEISPVLVDETSIMHLVSEDHSSARLYIRQFFSASTETPVKIEAVVKETGDSATWEGNVLTEGKAYMEIGIDKPRLWYPRWQGEQFRYTVVITIVNQNDGSVIKEITKKVGLRRVEIDQSPFPGGTHFKIIVNGNRVFAKGGDFIPVDMVYSQMTREKYEVAIDRAIENNFNALRVWGGGVYEWDDFYDLCDEKGIIVWQDFIGACATYPAFEKDFLTDYIKEVKYNIRRLSVYASLVIYCGNNEIDMFMKNGTEDLDRLSQYTDASLYFVVLPRALYEEGDNHFYHPSSPYSLNGRPPQDRKTGDQHPWGFAYNIFPYRGLACTFPDEGGLLGPTSLPTTMACLSEGQQFVHSYDYKLHDNCTCDHLNITPEIHAMERYLGVRKPIGEMSIPDSIYYLGFVHGEGLYEYNINFRRRMSEYTSASIFWMYNACWPETRSWGTVDYFGNRTPAFWPVKRSFQPVAVEFVDAGDHYDIYGISDLLTDTPATLSYGYMLTSGEIKLETVEVTVKANDSVVVAALAKEGLPEGAIPVLELEVEGAPLFRRRFIDKEHKLIGLEKTEIRVVKNGDGTATYTADKPVFGVCLDLDGDDGELSDNFFDLYPGRPYTVKLGKKSGDILYSYMGQPEA
ncbi:MAG: hypothetical protein IIX15_01535, partial [Clostridia bacterium]|nr:hypothetical protein [Clostridia bacterium]